MSIVLDSNIYISAALSVKGSSRSILKLAERSLFEVAIADPITDEIERILTKKLKWSQEKTDLWMNYIQSFTHRVEPRAEVHDCSDADDNRILECALESQAEIIVTGDNHLLVLHLIEESGF
jgi:uncharacterized protein